MLNQQPVTTPYPTNHLPSLQEEETLTLSHISLKLTSELLACHKNQRSSAMPAIVRELALIIQPFFINGIKVSVINMLISF